MQGFIVAAILERTGLDCQVCLVSEHDATQSDVVKYMNFDPKKLENCLTSVSWRQLEPDYIEGGFSSNFLPFELTRAVTKLSQIIRFER